MRLARLLAAASLVLLSGSFGTAHAADSELKIDFGIGRRPLTRTLTVALTPAPVPADEEPATTADNASVQLTSDLNGPGGQFPASQITLSATALGGQFVQVSALADPLEPEAVHHGTYTGKFIVGADGFTERELTLTVVVGDRSARKYELKVAGALAIGAIFGTVAKWLNDTGLALYPLRRRFHEVDESLRGATNLPVTYAAIRHSADAAMREGDVAGAQQYVATLERQRNGATALAEAIGRLSRTHRRHTALVRKRQLSGIEQVAQILANENDVIRAYQRTPLSGLSKAAQQATLDEDHFALHGEVLTCVHPTDKQAGMRTVLTRLCAKDYEGALAAWSKIDDDTRQSWATAAEDVPTPAVTVREADDEERETRTRRRTNAFAQVVKAWQWVQGKVLDHVRFYAGVLLVAFTVIVGYNERFLDDPGFTGSQRQYFTLFFFAAAVPLGGLQVVQLLGRVWPSGGGTAAPLPPPGPPAPEGDDASAETDARAEGEPA